MQIDKRVALVALMSLAAMASASCKDPVSNSNQQPNSPAAATTARWVAQFRSPSSRNFAGSSLATFFYSTISVVSPSVVFVAGDMPNAKNIADPNDRIAVVVRTTDGGQTWTETLIEQPGMKIPTLNSIKFVDANLGWAVGLDSQMTGIMLKTTDGGATWAATKLAFKQAPTTVYFVDANTGWMGGSAPAPGEDEGGPSDLLATTDGGRTWQSQRRLSTSISDIFFVDRMTGWASGHRGAIYHTEDGGQTWNAQRSELEPQEGPVDLTQPPKKFQVTGIHFINGQKGFAAIAGVDQEIGMVLGSDDGGAIWRRQWIVGDSGVRDVFAVSPTEAFAVTDKGRFIFHTTDGGQSWLNEPIEFEQELQIFRLGAADPSRVWAVGGGAIYYRVAGG